MPLFEYKGLDASGKAIKGRVEAESAKTARAKLKRNRLFITDIVEKSASAKKENSNKNVSLGAALFSRVKLNDIAMFTRQLASLLKANIPVVDALTALIEQTENEKMKVALSLIRQDVNEGTSLAKALLKHPRIFNNVYVNMIEAGEASGTLPVVLLRLADFQEGQVRLKGEVQSAMMYPLLMMAVSTILVLGIFTFIMPKMGKIFESMNKPLPLQTRVLMEMSNFLVNYWYIPLSAVVTFAWLFYGYINTTKGRRWWHSFLLKLPIFGPLIRMLAVARFANSMATLLAGGVPIITAMNIVKNIVGNVLIMEAIAQARENVSEGQSIAEPLKRSKQFPPLVIHMITIGEKTGELPQMLQNVSHTFEEQVSAKVDGLTGLLEPLMIIGMGAVIGVIVYSIFVPMMDLNSIR